jgi:hypothetical protein
MASSDEIQNHPDFKRLRKLMDDPRYWQKKDPTYVDMIREGFRKLYDTPAEAGQAANKAGVNGPQQAPDTEIAHVTRGEVVIPLSAQTPEVMRVLYQTLGRDMIKYTVGSGYEQRNPTSGLSAFADGERRSKPKSSPPECTPGRCAVPNPNPICIPFTDVCFNEWECVDCKPVGGGRG